jgi:hypothetical protein
MTDDEPPARPVFAGTDQESWAMFAERGPLHRKWAAKDAPSRPSSKGKSRAWGYADRHPITGS